MGKVTGFLEYNRVTGNYLPVEERLKNYKEFLIAPAAEELKKQGARCMDCGIPYCHAMGCPVYNLIPEWNDCIYKGDWKDAFLRLELTNNLPEITGRICPAPCEASCTLALNSAPVTIKQIELAIVENAFQQGFIVPRPPRKETGKKVAVIGSGPAGIAAAQQLRRMGYSVTVFEKNQKIGGILRYGIPDFKLEKWVIDRRVELLRAEGVNFVTNVLIGEDISAGYLRRSFDAVLLTVGAGEPRDLKVPGRGYDGIHFAMDYLTQSNKLVSGEIAPSHELINARNKVVLVIGGGDTGSDCVGTANRQGARKVYQFEIMPKPQACEKPSNPDWPYWPNILRTSSSHEEGCQRDWSIATSHFSGKDIKVEEGHFNRVEWRRDEKGQWKMLDAPVGSFSLKIDLVFLAMGFVHVEHSRLLDDLQIECDERGNIKSSNYCTSAAGVFTAGDANTGASLVVRAIYHGREAAKQVDEYLQG